MPGPSATETLAHTARRRLLYDLAIVAMILTVQGLITAYKLRPEVGTDDAEITHAYARNIAEGVGYVYNVGGEHVEGSTSLLWTLLNVPFFLVSDTPFIGLFCFAFILTGAILMMIIGIARFVVPHVTDRHIRTGLFVASLAFPSMFGWLLWSLLDVTLWVFWITASALISLALLTNRCPRSRAFSLIALWAVLPLVRPEGSFVVCLLACAMVVASPAADRRARARIAGLGVLGAALTLAIATAWRLAYFGMPFPNTYYAKARGDLRAQLLEGIRYVAGFLTWGPVTVALVLAALVAVTSVWLRGQSPLIPRAGAFTAICVLGLLALYAGLGGDHFAGFRLLLPSITLVLPFILAGFAYVMHGIQGDPARQLPPPKRRILLVSVGALAGLAVAPPGIRFLDDGDNMAVEYAVADTGRHVGSVLAREYNGDSPSIGIVAAGGIRMTYPGEIKDLVGLNWVEMAHAPREATQRPAGHLAFNSTVFWSSPPELMLPRVASCDEDQFVANPLLGEIFGELLTSDEFRSAYEFRCTDDIAYFALREEPTG